MTERRRVSILILIMIVTCFLVEGVSIMILYHTSFQQQRSRLVETAQSQARLIEAMARFNAEHSLDFPDGSEAATMSQVIDAHEQYKGFGKTGEFTLSRKEGDTIVFLLSHRHYDLDKPRPVPFRAELAEPMKQALLGNSGTMIGLDYRGVRVLAAYEPVKEIGLGIVAKIDLGEIREPFVKAGLITGMITIITVVAGAGIFLRVSGPILQKLDKRASMLEDLNGKMAEEIGLREKTEKALREGEERYRTLVETIPYGIQEINEEGVITFANPAYAAITGYEADELAGTLFYDLLPTHSEKELLRKDIEFFVNEQPEPESYYNKNLKKDGNIIDLRVDWNYKRDGLGQVAGFVSIVTDITSQKKAEEALIWESTVNSAIAELSSSLISKQSIEEISDTALETAKKITGSQFGYVGHIDPETGYLVCSTMSRGVWDICSVDNKAVVFKEFNGLFGWVLNNKKSLVSNDPASDPRSTGTPDGHIGIRRFISSPALIEDTLVGQVALVNKETDYTDQDLVFVERLATLYAIAIQRNRAENDLAALNHELEDRVRERTDELETEVAERKQAEQKLMQSKAMLQAVFDGISDPLVMVGKDMAVRMMNKAATRYYGVDPDVVKGRPCYESLMDNNGLCGECKIPDSVLSARDLTYERKGVQNPDHYERVRVYPLNGPSVESGAIIHIADITESKRIEAQLIRADRLSSLGQLSGGIAHEIRNPLASIRLFTDILNDDSRYGRSSEEKELLEDINQNISRIDGIIKRVLNFSKPVDMISGTIDVNTIIRGTLRLFSIKLMDMKIKHRLALSENIPLIGGDPISLQQVVTNLVINAMEAMNRGGVLNITTFETRSSLFRMRPVVAIVMKDTGQGIRPDQRETIFNPFFTTKSTGTGLGLAISHQIVEHHGGIIYVESKPGEGSIFTIELPIKKES